MDSHDCEILKDCLKLSYKKCSPLNTRVWYASQDMVTLVAHILKDEYAFSGDSVQDSLENLIYYYEKPWKWEGEMEQLIKDYEVGLIEKHFRTLTPEQMAQALPWIDTLYSDKTSKEMEEILEDTIA